MHKRVSKLGWPNNTILTATVGLIYKYIVTKAKTNI